MDKKVDDTWKELVEKERQKADSEKTADLKEADFPSFLSSLFIQALVSLGEIENPVTKQKEANLEQARYIIDIISLLKDKTKGNLNSDEGMALDNILYELRMRYISKSK